MKGLGPVDVRERLPNGCGFRDLFDVHPFIPKIGEPIQLDERIYEMGGPTAKYIFIYFY